MLSLEILEQQMRESQSSMANNKKQKGDIIISNK